MTFADFCKSLRFVIRLIHLLTTQSARLPPRTNWAHVWLMRFLAETLACWLFKLTEAKINAKSKQMSGWKVTNDKKNQANLRNGVWATNDYRCNKQKKPYNYVSPKPTMIHAVCLNYFITWWMTACLIKSKQGVDSKGSLSSERLQLVWYVFARLPWLSGLSSIASKIACLASQDCSLQGLQ